MIKRLKEKTIQFLRWSEQYTKTDMVYLAKGSFWTWLGKGTQIITGTAMAIAFANLLPKEIYGNYKYILSVAGVLGAFTLNGMGEAVTRSVARGYEGSLKQGTKEMFKWSIFIVISALVVAGYYFWQGNALLGSGMLLIAAFQPIIKTATLYQSHLFGKKLFRIQSIYLVIWEIMQAAFIMAALFLTNSALVLVGILFLLNAFITTFFLWKTLKKYIENKKIEIDTVKYGKHLSLIRLISIGANHIDKILIFQFLGAAELAIYSFAVLPIDKIKSLLKSIPKIAFPKFSNTTKQKIKNSLPWKVFIFFLICTALAISFILISPLLFDLLFPEYQESVWYSQIYALILIFFPLTLFGNALTAQGQKRDLYKINVTHNVLKITLLILLLPQYGIVGAICALLISRLVSDLLSGYLFSKMI